jgi:hypothetical protein
LKIHTGALLIGMAGFAGIVALTVTRIQDSQEPRAVQLPAVAPAINEETLELASSAPARGPQSVARMSPSEAFLANYWGDQWPAVKAELDAHQVSYAERDPITVPWETAAAEIEKRLPLKEEEREAYKSQFMGWKGIADREWMISRFGSAPPLDPQASVEVSQIAERHAREIELHERSSRSSTSS